VRGLTRRLERLQAGVEKLGGGDLAARVKVEGRDEVARLAQSFNAAAARIEALVGAHKMLLANASHELRTPLSRIRLGLELMKQNPDPAREAALERDIAELDALIEEVLLASRLDAVGELEVREAVDLLALAAEEAARYDDVRVTGVPVLVPGDPRLLRRLMRNLLENAAHHGAPPVAVEVARDGARARLSVRDAGPGIPPDERERIFEPFRRGRATSAASGSGLGLALVRQIARRHGGEATLAPTEGCPTNRILIDLPVA
jgi:signal transduction histidine kinase